MGYLTMLLIVKLYEVGNDGCDAPLAIEFHTLPFCCVHGRGVVVQGFFPSQPLVARCVLMRWGRESQFVKTCAMQHAHEMHRNAQVRARAAITSNAGGQVECRHQRRKAPPSSRSHRVHERSDRARNGHSKHIHDDLDGCGSVSGVHAQPVE